MISEEFAVVWDSLSEETKNQVVVSHLKSLSKWDLKRILCDVLDVEHYMDDEGLKKATESIINVRRPSETKLFKPCAVTT